jgi:hypothetical protein
MTAGGEAVANQFAVRVMVTPVWDQVTLAADAGMTVADLKRRALAQALQRPVPADDYIVKFRGAQVLDESATLSALGAIPNAPFIVLPARRQPIR